MTHVFVDPDSINWTVFLTSQIGSGTAATGGPNYFTGAKYMRGFGTFQKIAQFLTPVVRNLAQSAGQEGVHAGVKVLGDMSEGKNFIESLREHTSKGLTNLGDRIQQCGKGDGSGSASKRRSRLKLKKIKNYTSSNVGSRRTIRSFPQLPVEETLPVGNGGNVKSTKLALRRRRRPDQLDYY